jgi:RHS repeat-associated protein
MHEHYKEYGLINMNGRMYDPIVGRMLSPDTYVQDPTNSQNYNRYSYVLNNPLKYTDPTGWKYNYNESTNQGEVYDYPVSYYDANYGKGTSGGFGGGMGFSSMFGIVASQYGAGTALSAYNNGFNAGAGTAFGSAFAGRGWSGTASVRNFRNYKTFHYASMQDVGIGTAGGYYTYGAATVISFYQAFSSGTLSGNYWGNATASNGKTPFGVGWEWLTGTGPRHRDFTNGDYFTKLLQQHSHVQDTRNLIATNIMNDGPLQGNSPYSLGGPSGVIKYLKDYSTLLTLGTTGNLAVTYLGRYYNKA